MSIENLNSKIKNKIWLFIKDKFYHQRMTDVNLIRNINFDSTNRQPSLLICYRANGYFTNMGKNLGRTVLHEIFKIVKVFSDLNYCIDIIDCNDISSLKLIENKRYDVIFGFGETFSGMVKMQSSAVSILYMTENHPNFSYSEEQKRVDYFYERHGKWPTIQRSGVFYKLSHFDKIYSHVITLGEIEPLKYQYENPNSLYPSGIINSKFRYKNKNHKLSRRNVLWLGSKGAIHKGLDILIDVLSTREDITLHVCGLTKQDRKFLNFSKRKNIVDYGHINIESDLFLKIVDTCTYTILPSCSEGFATSITTGMLHGLIPVVMKNSGFNRLGDLAIFLDDFKINYVDSRLTELVNTSPEDLNIFSKKVFCFARENFLISSFEKNFKSIILNLLNKND